MVMLFAALGCLLRGRYEAMHVMMFSYLALHLIELQARVK